MSLDNNGSQELPEGWTAARIGDLAEYINGRGFKKSEWEGKGRPIIRIGNLTGSADGANYTTLDVDERYVIPAGTILVSWSATLDAFIWGGPEGVLNQHIFKVVPYEEVVDKGFLFRLLKREIQEMIHGAKLQGSTMKHIRREPFLQHEAPLPPLPEQRRIAERIDAIESHSRKARETLSRLPALLDEYHYGVLHAAFSGRLTADWRANHRTTEPASGLIDRAKREHRAQWEEYYRQSRYERKGKEPPSGWKDRYSHPKPVEADELNALPESWEWTTLEQLGRWTGGSTPRRSKDEYWEEGTIPWVSPKDMKSTEIYETEDNMTSLAFEEDNQSLVPEGSILFVTRSGILRRTLPISIARTDVTINQDLKALIPVPSVNHEFLLYWALAKEHDLRFNTMKQGTTVESIQSSKLYSYPIALPPAEEQQEIVRRVKQRLDRIDQLAQHVEKAQTRMDSLDRAVLAKALRGELVETEAALAEREDRSFEAAGDHSPSWKGHAAQNTGTQAELALE